MTTPVHPMHHKHRRAQCSLFPSTTPNPAYELAVLAMLDVFLVVLEMVSRIWADPMCPAFTLHYKKLLLAPKHKMYGASVLFIHARGCHTGTSRSTLLMSSC